MTFTAKVMLTTITLSGSTPLQNSVSSVGRFPEILVQVSDIHNISKVRQHIQHRIGLIFNGSSFCCIIWLLLFPEDVAYILFLIGALTNFFPAHWVNFIINIQIIYKVPVSECTLKVVISGYVKSVIFFHISNSYKFTLNAAMLPLIWDQNGFYIWLFQGQKHDH